MPGRRRPGPRGEIVRRRGWGKRVTRSGGKIRKMLMTKQMRRAPDTKRRPCRDTRPVRRCLVGLARHGLPSYGALLLLLLLRAIFLVHGTGARRAHPAAHAVGALRGALLVARPRRLGARPRAHRSSGGGRGAAGVRTRGSPFRRRGLARAGAVHLPGRRLWPGIAGAALGRHGPLLSGVEVGRATRTGAAAGVDGRASRASGTRPRLHGTG